MNTNTLRAARRGRPSQREAIDDDGHLEWMADWLDSVFRIPGLGIRFGLDAVLGLLPGIGDTLTSLASLYILAAAGKRGVPRITVARMALNVAIDYLVGSIPLVGDAFDVYWKANKRNVALLRQHAAASPAERQRAQRGDRLFVIALIAGLLVVLAASIGLTIYLLILVGRLLFGG